MTWDVEYTEEFARWWDALSEDEQESVAVAVELLEARGPQLGYPYKPKNERKDDGQEIP